MKFATKTYMKLEWIKNATAEGGAMAKVIADAADDAVTVLSHTKKMGRMWTSMCPDILMKLVRKNRGLYEVITRFPHKLYFDIDQVGEVDQDALIKDCKAKIAANFPGEEFAISGSFTPEKSSLHIVVPNYVISSEAQRADVKQIAKQLGEPFDWKVYTNNRNMKAINQSKRDGRVQQVLENTDAKQHMITCFIAAGAKPVPVPELTPEEKQQRVRGQALDISKLEPLKLKLPKAFNSGVASDLDLLKLAPLDSTKDHSYTHFIARFCFHHGITFDQFWDWNKQKCASVERCNKWKIHWNKLDKFPAVKVKSMLFLLHRFYPDIFQNNRFRLFKEHLQVQPDKLIKKFTKRMIACKQKYVLANLPMGFGKTAATIKYLKNKAFVWITPRRSLAKNTFQRIKDCFGKKAGGAVTCYLNVTSAAQKAAQLPAAQQLIIGTQSLHYVQANEYPVVVIDEIESVLHSWTAEKTHGPNLHDTSYQTSII